MYEQQALDHFASEGLITETIRPLKSGKEATVWLCRGGGTLEAPLAAVKVYRPREHRGFRNDALYREGSVILNARDGRAVAKKTSHGRKVEQGLWMWHEWETLRALHAAGAIVPRPIAVAESAILMEYIGDEDTPAPQLKSIRLDPEEAAEAFRAVMAFVELALIHNVVHADLSSFNILYWEGSPVVIDLPQAVDPRTNPNAYDLLARDVANVCSYFSRFGVEADPDELARDLWVGFTFATL